MASEATQKLRRAWMAWNEHPAYETEAKAMESACGPLASTLDMDVTRFRIWLMNIRRNYTFEATMRIVEEVCDEDQ